MNSGTAKTIQTEWIALIPILKCSKGTNNRTSKCKKGLQNETKYRMWMHWKNAKMNQSSGISGNSGNMRFGCKNESIWGLQTWSDIHSTKKERQRTFRMNRRNNLIWGTLNRFPHHKWSLLDQKRTVSVSLRAFIYIIVMQLAFYVPLLSLRIVYICLLFRAVHLTAILHWYSSDEYLRQIRKSE